MASKDYVLPDADALKKLLVKENDSSSAVIIRLAWQAGLTAAEIVNLRWEDVDLSSRALIVSGRTIPLSEDLLGFLRDLVKQGIYVVYSPKSKGGPMSRISASNKARLALDSAGQTQVRLWDLRFDYIVRRLQDQPIEAVSRTTACELRSLQEIYKRYIQGKTIPGRAKKRYELDNEQLRKAIESEPDNLDAKIIMLAWICNLSLDEISKLMWEDVELSGRKLIVKGIKYDVPVTVFDVLRSEKASSEYDQYVLHGIRSGNQLPIEFLSKRAGEFFARHKMENLTISNVRGRYGVPSDSVLKKRVMDLLSKSVGLPLTQISKALNCNNADTARLLDELIVSVDIKISPKHLYMLSSHETNWDKFSRAMDMRLSRNATVSPADIADATGLSRNLIDYYLNRALTNGLIVKVARGQYCRPPQS